MESSILIGSLCVFLLFNRDHYLRWISGRTEIYKVKVNEVNIQDIGLESFISFEDDSVSVCIVWYSIPIEN